MFYKVTKQHLLSCEWNFKRLSGPVPKLHQTLPRGGRGQGVGWEDGSSGDLGAVKGIEGSVVVAPGLVRVNMVVGLSQWVSGVKGVRVWGDRCRHIRDLD